MTTLICNIYRCGKKEGMYLYLEKTASLDDLPESLQKTTGRMELAMTLTLTPEKKLARARASDVMAAISSQGFYLQLPPTLSAEAQASSEAINQANHFLER